MNLLQPPTVKVVAALCVVRNSVGENCYVADEVITAKSGARVRVGNTDAEGRMAMADALYHLKEMALCSVNPHLFTIATLTGHAMLSAGPGYSVSYFLARYPFNRISVNVKITRAAVRIPISRMTI